jgi:hypothetical protein
MLYGMLWAGSIGVQGLACMVHAIDVTPSINDWQAAGATV